jgi:hypothetical protein
VVVGTGREVLTVVVREVVVGSIPPLVVPTVTGGRILVMPERMGGRIPPSDDVWVEVPPLPMLVDVGGRRRLVTPEMIGGRIPPPDEDEGKGGVVFTPVPEGPLVGPPVTDVDVGGRRRLVTPEMIGGRIPPLEEDEEGGKGGEGERVGVVVTPVSEGPPVGPLVGGRRMLEIPETIGGRIPP